MRELKLGGFPDFQQVSEGSSLSFGERGPVLRLRSELKGGIMQ